VKYVLHKELLLQVLSLMSGEEEVAKVQTVFVQVHELAQTVCYYNHVVN